MKIKIASLIAAIFLIAIPIAQAAKPLPRLSAAAVTDTALGTGTSFSIDITATKVENLWGFQLLLTYDPAILTATSFASYAPFDIQWPSSIGSDYVELAFSAQFGAPGFTGSGPIASISFDVNDDGSSILDMQGTVLMDTGGNPIGHELVDGFFSNIADKFGVEVQRASAEHRRWVESTDSTNTITARVKNTGSDATEAEVVFTFTDKSGVWTYSEHFIVSLAAKESLDISMTIDRVWLILRGAPPPIYGTYYVSIEVLWRAAHPRGTTVGFTLQQ